jgi:peptidoglycan/xylan/chitin deacetylase (PgdA/CDA1 family)
VTDAVPARPRGGERAGRLLILCYHAVSADWPVPGAIDPRTLERQLHQVLRRGYQPRTLDEGLRAPHGERSLCVTFDDGFESVFRLGLPLLQRLGVPATLFVPTDYVESGEPMCWSTLGRWAGTAHEAELRPMSWDEVRELARQGWEIGSHTRSHPHLTAIEEGQALDELIASRDACEERLQAPCRALAYPFGDWDEATVGQAAAAGYERAVTLANRLIEPIDDGDPLALSREGIYRNGGALSFAVGTSPALRRLRASRSYRRIGRRLQAR